MDFTQALTFHIDKLVGTLKDEKELKEVIKRKFTRKEYKVFVAIEEEKTLEEVCELISEDLERVEKLYETALWKINQEKIKKELVNL